MLPLLLPLAFADAPVTVPYERLSSGHVVIDVAVEGAAAVPFALDTGASVTVLTPDTWRAAGGDPDRGLKVGGKGAGGAMGGIRVATDVDITVTSLPIHVGAALLMDLPEPLTAGEAIAGLLGRDVLRRYVVELDEGRHALTLHPAGAEVTPTPPMMTLPMKKVRSGITSVQVSIGGQPVEAVIDLGASVSILNEAARALAGVTPGEGCEGVALGADQNEIALGCVSVTGFSLGSEALPATILRAGPLPIFHPLHLEKRPAMILGMDLLAGRHLVLDDGRKTLRLSAVGADG